MYRKWWQTYWYWYLICRYAYLVTRFYTVFNPTVRALFKNLVPFFTTPPLFPLHSQEMRSHLPDFSLCSITIT